MCVVIISFELINLFIHFPICSPTRITSKSISNKIVNYESSHKPRIAVYEHM